MSLFLLFLILSVYSPADSCRNLVTLREIPQRAILFAEVAAGQGGNAGINLAKLLEVYGDFAEANICYGIARSWITDPESLEWLHGRLIGTKPLDTLILVTATITNLGTGTAEDIEIKIPLPVSHPPYQQIEILGSGFTEDDGILKAEIDRITAGTTRTINLLIHITQVPYTFRPLPSSIGGMPFDELANIVRSVPQPYNSERDGPCLGMASHLQNSLTARGADIQIVGGLLRKDRNTIVFHAWNLLDNDGTIIPIDPVLFDTDSLRGIGHSSTDMIPLWDLGTTDLNEITAYFPGGRGYEIDVGITISFTNPEAVLDTLHTILPWKN